MNIRKANKEDNEVILTLVQKLGAYERKKPEEISLTLNKIDSHGFSNEKYFEVLIAEYNAKPVGLALYFFSYSGSAGAPLLYLEDLFVESEYRKKGLGKALLSELAKIAIQKECCRMEWHAYTWNESAIQFYESIGAVPKTDLRLFRLTGDHLLQLARD